MGDKAKFEGRILPEPMSGCWLWIGALFNHGYGKWVRLNGRKWNVG